MKYIVEQLITNKLVKFRPKGNSMQPLIFSGNLITISSDISNLKINDIVFCKVKNNYYIHLITAIKDNQFQISNNKNYVNGWITKNSIYGKVIKIEN